MLLVKLKGEVCNFTKIKHSWLFFKIFLIVQMVLNRTKHYIFPLTDIRSDSKTISKVNIKDVMLTNPCFCVTFGEILY